MCHKNAECTNKVGSYECFCLFGFYGDGRSCADVDECGDGNSLCSKDANCVNNPGSYMCLCKNGYSGNGTHCNGTMDLYKIFIDY